MRVRQEAQFALAARGEAGSRTFARVAGSKEDLLARIHAVWGLGQIARLKGAGRSLSLWDVLSPMLDDPDAEVRAQAARVLGEAREARAFDRLIGRLSDDSPRVRFFAAMALGKLGRPEAVGPLLGMLRANADKDPYLRHAAVMGLVGSGDVAAIERAIDDESTSARMGVLLALRRLGDPEVARFLKDRDPRLVLEAARAINDVPIAGALRAAGRIADHAGHALATVAPGAQRQPPAGRIRAGRGGGRGRRPVRPARVAARPGVGDAGQLGQAVGAGRSDGSLAADRAADRPSRPWTRCGRSWRRSCPDRRIRSGLPRRWPPRRWASRRPATLWWRWPPTATRPTAPAPRP